MNLDPRTLAILQNQWGRIDAKTQARIDAMPVDVHTRYVSFCLFAGCLTGRRLEKAFDRELIESIAWQDASRKVSETASGCHPHDVEHIDALMRRYRPKCVLLFGKIAAGWL